MPGIVSRSFLSTMSVILLFMIPMITMALFSEEKKRGTIELLLTAPITDLQVVLGKFFAAASFFVILLPTTWIPMAVLYIFGKPGVGSDSDGIPGIASLRSVAGCHRAVHFDADGEPDHRRCAELRNDHAAVAGRRHGERGTGDIEGRADVPFDSESPG